MGPLNVFTKGIPLLWILSQTDICDTFNRHIKRLIWHFRLASGKPKKNKNKKGGFTATVVHCKISHWTHQGGRHRRKCECAQMSMRPFPFSPHTAHLMRRLALHHRTKLYTPRATIMSLKALQSLSCSQFLHLLPFSLPPRLVHRLLPSPSPAFTSCSAHIFLLLPSSSSFTTLLYHLW